MAGIGLPVPPGFTITTEVCVDYLAKGADFDRRAARRGGRRRWRISKRRVGKTFGDAADPLLVSVRSGARVSMPGMMDTVLNLGLNDATVEGLAATSGDARFAWDSYRRFIQMYSDVVLGLDHHLFEDALEIAKEDNGYFTDVETAGRGLAGAGRRVQGDRRGRAGPPVPAGRARAAVGRDRAPCSISWDSDRAKVYRRLNDIPGDWGTAVNVQAMVFGNMGDTSATGVAFTRDPATGERAYYGEWLVNAQGEDVVAGIRTPQYLTKARARGRQRQAAVDGRGDARGLWRAGRACSTCSKRITATCRTSSSPSSAASCGCCRPAAASAPPRRRCKMAVDMVGEGLIDEATAIRRVDPMALDQLLHPTLDPDARARCARAAGLPASPGAASGAIVFDADTAETPRRDAARR